MKRLPDAAFEKALLELGIAWAASPWESVSSGARRDFLSGASERIRGEPLLHQKQIVGVDEL